MTDIPGKLIMNKLFRLIPAGIFLLALAGCRGFLPASPFSGLKAQAASTQTYLAVDQIVPSAVIKDYLNQKVGATAYGGKVFSAYQVMGVDRSGQVIKLYLWALVQEYYLDQTTLTEGTGSSEPVVLFIKMQSGKYVLFDFKDAGEGYQYLTVNFPPSIRRLINLPADAYNLRVSLLTNENLLAARAYYGIK